MIGNWLRIALRLVFLILLQGLIVNRLDLWQGYMLPWVYIFGLLMLPFETPRWLTLFIAFGTGLMVDLFTNTAGVHTGACTLLGFMQPLVLRTLAPREGYENGQTPTIQDLGVGWYLTFATTLTLIHHITLFFLELWRFSPFFTTFGKALLSALATIVMLVLGQYLIFKPDRRRK